MQFLAILTRRIEAFSEAEFAEVLGPEALRARELYAEGRLRALHSRGDVPGAVLLVEAADETEARATVGRLPLVEREMAEVQIIPLRPYRGFVPART